MPPATKKKVQTKVEDVVEPTPSANGAPVYPHLYIEGVDLTTGKVTRINPVTHLTYESAQTLIGWETETKYSIEQAKRNPGTKPEDECNKLGPNALFEDPFTGEKVHCHFNGRNRPFDMAYTLRYLQDMANRRWAGTLRVPYDTVNGETCIVGNMGNVISAQKRIIAFIFLCEIWHKKSDPRHARVREVWPEEPTLPCILVFGVSEHPDVVRTLDNVQPRSETDVVFTTGMFDNVQVPTGIKSKPFTNPTPAQKKDMSKMMAAATDMLWRRTGMSESLFLKYQTHGESVDFMSRHSTLQKCVAHVYQENGVKVTYEEVAGRTGKVGKRKIKIRGISQLKVSAGECAAFMYMMACSGVSCEGYHKTNREDRDESLLNFTRYDKAAQFIALIADQDSSVGMAIRDVRRPQLGEGANEYGGVMFTGQEGGSREERMAVIAKAWNFWVAGQEFDDETLKLGYRYTHNKGDDLVTGFTLHEKVTIGGIDLGEPDRSKEEVAGEVSTTDYVEVPTSEEEVFEGDDGFEIEEVESAIEEAEAERAAEFPVEETPEQERARRAVVEEEPGRVPRKIKRK